MYTVLTYSPNPMFHILSFDKTMPKASMQDFSRPQTEQHLPDICLKFGNLTLERFNFRPGSYKMPNVVSASVPMRNLRGVPFQC